MSYKAAKTDIRLVNEALVRANQLKTFIDFQNSSNKDKANDISIHQQ